MACHRKVLVLALAAFSLVASMQSKIFATLSLGVRSTAAINPTTTTKFSPDLELKKTRALPSDLESFDTWFDFLRDSAKKRGKVATFVQIGANDGKANDPLYGHWKIGTPNDTRSSYLGLLVEPTEVLFHQVHERHNTTNWSFFQGAVIPSCSPKTKTVGFWASPKSGKPSKAKRAFVEQGQVNAVNPHPGFKHKLKQVIVPCVQGVQELLEKHASEKMKQVAVDPVDGIWSIDLLQIDVECDDADLIAGIDFKRVRPRLIHFEDACTDVKKAVSKLVANGYAVLSGKSAYNLIAVDVSLLSGSQ